MIETRDQLETPGVLRRGVAALGVLASEAESCKIDKNAAVGRLRRLGTPEALDPLFRLALRTSLRRGPEGAAEVGSPAGLLSVAAAGAAAGALPLWNVVALRDSLISLEGQMRRAGAWAEDEPFWWRPLPEPEAPEAAWRELDDGLRFPVRQRGGEVSDSGWVSRPDAVAPAIRRRVAEELDALDSLDLRPAGTGYGDRLSSRRSDEVRYVTGLEPELLEPAPTLAALIQRLLHDAETALAHDLPPGTAHPPQTAMLARYRAPCDGFAAHLDNPGGEDDNGRTQGLVFYLNPPGRVCAGGGLALWRSGGSTEEPPAAVLPPAGGSAVRFDARRVPHAVEPLEAGADRWTLVLWLSDRPRRPPRPLLPVPDPEPAEALAPLGDPPVAEGTVILRRIEGAPAIVRAGERADRSDLDRVAAFVTTVRRPGPALDAWCRHHLELGAGRLLVVLDGEDEEGAAPPGGPPDGRVTVWSAAEARERRAGWLDDPGGIDAEALAALADHARRGRATWAVASRQALNASAAVRAAAAGELGDGIGWLVHLDADELFHLEGRGRGGATLEEHFAAVRAAGWRTVRYLNHELLLSEGAGGEGAPLRFKRNPALAAARLGPVGWMRLAGLLGLEQEGPRPYFRAYWNGKGAVDVTAGGWAPGVHGWRVPGTSGVDREPLLAGPSILHYHLPSSRAFRSKYLEQVGKPAPDTGAADRPFPPSRLERAAADLLAEPRGAGAAPDEVAARLDALYAETCVFDSREVDLLEEAGLLFTPEIRHPPVLPAGPALVSSSGS